MQQNTQIVGNHQTVSSEVSYRNKRIDSGTGPRKNKQSTVCNSELRFDPSRKWNWSSTVTCAQDSISNSLLFVDAETRDGNEKKKPTPDNLPNLRTPSYASYISKVQRLLAT